jgi:hypothetical protein
MYAPVPSSAAKPRRAMMAITQAGTVCSTSTIALRDGDDTTIIDDTVIVTVHRLSVEEPDVVEVGRGDGGRVGDGERVVDVSAGVEGDSEFE